MAEDTENTSTISDPAPPALSRPGILRRCVALTARHALPLVAAAGWASMITAMLPAFAGAGPARDHLGGAQLPGICKASATLTEGKAT